MGGKALKHLGVKRLSEADYIERRKQFESKITTESFLADWQGRFALPAYMPGKADHGDLDVVYHEPEHGPRLVDIVVKALESRGQVKNGDCHSIEWANFQVDLIKTTALEFNFATHYYSHGTHAALMGRLAHYYGFKLGWNGLYMTLRTKNSKRDILLTQKWHKAMDALGYSEYLSQTSIVSQDEVFNHITSSKYFCKDIFRSTKPDRNYGFQEEFYAYALQLPEGVNFKPSKGWQMLLKAFGLHRYLDCWYQYKCMQLEELVRPLKRAWRKFWHVKLKPFAFKLLGYL